MAALAHGRARHGGLHKAACVRRRSPTPAYTHAGAVGVRGRSEKEDGGRLKTTLTCGSHTSVVAMRRANMWVIWILCVLGPMCQGSLTEQIQRNADRMACGVKKV
jgi:hypothetical protein